MKEKVGYVIQDIKTGKYMKDKVYSFGWYKNLQEAEFLFNYKDSYLYVNVNGCLIGDGRKVKTIPVKLTLVK